MRKNDRGPNYRLIHEKGFGAAWPSRFLCPGGFGFSAYAMINNGRSIALDQLYFYGYGLDSFIPVAGLVLAAVISFFVGTEYSSQTLRNALIIGRTRTEIYLSHYAVSLIVALIYQGVYALIVVLVGWPVFGGFHLSGTLIGLGTLIGVLALAAYCALFNAVGLL
ncbi:MAG: ABC transporter permease [Holdemania massiliensis]